MKLFLNCSSHFTLSYKIDSLLGFWFPLNSIERSKVLLASYFLQNQAKLQSCTPRILETVNASLKLNLSSCSQNKLDESVKYVLILFHLHVNIPTPNIFMFHTWFWMKFWENIGKVSQMETRSLLSAQQSRHKISHRYGANCGHATGLYALHVGTVRLCEVTTLLTGRQVIKIYANFALFTAITQFPCKFLWYVVFICNA